MQRVVGRTAANRTPLVSPWKFASHAPSVPHYGEGQCGINASAGHRPSAHRDVEPHCGCLFMAPLSCVHRLDGAPVALADRRPVSLQLGRAPLKNFDASFPRAKDDRRLVPTSS
jgi:hypothetical protein